jgi:ribonuclease HI
MRSKPEKWIEDLRLARPGIEIEIRWYPAHQGVAGNEKADAWVRLAVEEPDAHGVKWLVMPTGMGDDHASAQISRKRQTGDLGEEVG